MKKKSQKQIQSADQLEIEFKVDREESLKFGKIYGFCDITGNFLFDFRATSGAMGFSSSFFELFIMAISVKNCQVPQN